MHQGFQKTECIAEAGTAVSRILNEPVEISGSGRTDAGAHARGQVANFHCESAMKSQEILEQLQHIPFSPRYIIHRYTPCTYPVQDGETRNIIEAAKVALAPHGIYLLGRFAEWEYYNMDAAMEAAINLVSRLEA